MIHLLIHIIYELTMENSVDPDQLAFTLFSIEFIVYIWFHTVLKKFIYGLSKRRAKLSSLCIIRSVLRDKYNFH